jgi:hypothetical protein
VRLRPPQARARQLPELDVFSMSSKTTFPPASNHSEGGRSVRWSRTRQSRPLSGWRGTRGAGPLWHCGIETWHRVIKSGCRIETRQFGALERFVRARPCLPSSSGASTCNRARQAHGLPLLMPEQGAPPWRDLLDDCEHLPHRAEHVLDLLLFDDERRRERDDVARVTYQNAGL